MCPTALPISGEKSQLDGVNEIKLLQQVTTILTVTFKVTLSLTLPAGKVNLSQKEIKIHIPVEEFIEKKIPYCFKLFYQWQW